MGFPQGSHRGLSGNVTPAQLRHFLGLVEVVLETPGQYHFVSTLAPLPAHTASSLSLSNRRKPTPTPGCWAYMMPISRVDLMTI